MTRPAPFDLTGIDLDRIAGLGGHVAVIVSQDGKLDSAARRVNRLTKGALARFVESPAFAEMESGDIQSLGWPSGMEADGVLVARLEQRPSVEDARRAGVGIARAAKAAAITVLWGGNRKGARDLTTGLLLRGYDYSDQKTGDAAKDPGTVTLMAARPDEVRPETEDLAAVAEGVFLTRDLVNAPANVLTTTEYARRLEALGEDGLEVEVLDEAALAEIGMGALLAVGQGSDSPSKVVVLRWNGGGDAAPFALVGKGVVFDTGGISLKPAAGMEGMTMDMGGSAVVAGVMKTLALRKARANVVGIVGLVENMPSGRAMRPGDVVASLKGDTIEVINTDAEGRLVLCDIMWYVQERFQPTGMIDLATLTGAIIIGLGHENAGVFSNDDALCRDLLKAADAEGEGAWRMPLGKAYAKQLKSRIADVKNVGGRPAGSITAAEFLHRFVKDGMPWAHIDIAGVASTEGDSPYAPKGATGWGVRALDRLIRETCEG